MVFFFIFVASNILNAGKGLAIAIFTESSGGPVPNTSENYRKRFRIGRNRVGGWKQTRSSQH